MHIWPTAAIILLYLLFPGCRASPPPAARDACGSIESGETLLAVLARNGIGEGDRAAIIRSLSAICDTRLCHAGDRWEISRTPDGVWSAFQYLPHGRAAFVVTRSSMNTVSAQRIERTGSMRQASYAGTLRTSLWESMSAQAVPPEMILSFADIFAWQIDFLTEPRTGDRYRFIVDERVADDGTVLERSIRAAQYLSGGKTHTAILFASPGKPPAYFDISGHSLQSAFLRAPLQYRRISSFFTRRRFHPVLKYFRPHLGIDYAAPAGTPVSSVGEGVVRFAGWRGGYGNSVIIAHAQGYASQYGHLLSVARGLSPGDRIRQGQVIGKVGSTGISTGPHLDFRMTHNGRFINFLSMKRSSDRQVPTADRAAYRAIVRPLLSRLAAIH